MNTDVIPEEIMDWIRSHTDNITLGLIAQGAWTKGAEKMYMELAPEIALLKEEIDAYRDALVNIRDGRSDYPDATAERALDQYPSPKE